MEESEEFEEPETAPSGADSGGAAATAVGLLPNSTKVIQGHGQMVIAFLTNRKRVPSGRIPISPSY